MKYIVELDGETLYLVAHNTTTGAYYLVPANVVDSVPTQGAKGDKGEPGAIGPPGFIEKSWDYEGHGPPSDIAPITPGTDGQHYFDIDTGDLYERTNGLWL